MSPTARTTDTSDQTGLGHYRDAHVCSLTGRHTRRAITNTAHNENYTNKHTNAHTHANRGRWPRFDFKVLTSHIGFKSLTVI